MTIAPETRVVELSVGGMTCASCAARVQKRLNRVEGVHAAVSFASERATIQAPSELSVADLIAQVEAAGYSAAPAGDSSEEADHRRLLDLRRRLVVALVLTMPLENLCILWPMGLIPRVDHWQLVLIALATPVVTWCAWPFHRAAWINARHGATSMDTLVSLGIIAASLWSLYAMFALPFDGQRSGVSLLFRAGGGQVYVGAAAGVATLLLIGRVYEAGARRSARSALRSLAALGAKEATLLLPDDAERRVPAALLSSGDRFLVRPGETIATDGVVVAGSAAIDASQMTGESRPVHAVEGDDVLGGTTALDGRLVIEALRPAADSHLAQMVHLVEQAQAEKSHAQRLADRVSAVLVPAVIVVAGLTLVGWLALGASTATAVGASIAVLVVACPCALGLATPTALMVSAGAAAENGVFVKRQQALEMATEIDTVVLDKTGTVTTGRLEVEAVGGGGGTNGPDPGWLRLAGALEAGSEHAVGTAITARARTAFGNLPEVQDFEAHPGMGATGAVEGHAVAVGSPTFVASLIGARVVEPIVSSVAAEERSGRTVVLVAVDGRVCGYLALTDQLRDTAAAAVTDLKRLGLRVLLVTGDNPGAAQGAADRLGIDEVRSRVLPDAKAELVRSLQAEGHRVCFVGDGLNDGAALACADLGMAIGSGTDLAIDAADVVLSRDDLGVVSTAISLARATVRTIQQNLRWAVGYNLVAIPFAMLGFLNPLLAGAAMTTSSTLVLWNSLRLHERFAPASNTYAARLAALAPGTVPEVEAL
ncbi:MAG TPA: cation-translocating P-type ATPase [Actinomycetes bacterium]|nr:cation-translocating P-type ATPase [Actinomycetes bacterium]